jgi:hypothetical protein
VLGQILGYGRYPYGNYGYNQYGNQSMAVDQCARSVEARLNGYRGGYYGYGNMPYGGQYGYNGYGGGGARVLGISRVEPRSNGGLTVRGVATSGRYAGYTAQPPVDLTWRCKADYRGYIADIDITPAQRNYGAYGNYRYTPYANDYSQYGYSRY